MIGSFAFGFHLILCSQRMDMNGKLCFCFSLFTSSCWTSTFVWIRGETERKMLCWSLWYWCETLRNQRTQCTFDTIVRMLSCSNAVKVWIFTNLTFTMSFTFQSNTININSVSSIYVSVWKERYQIGIEQFSFVFFLSFWKILIHSVYRMLR